MFCASCSRELICPDKNANLSGGKMSPEAMPVKNRQIDISNKVWILNTDTSYFPGNDVSFKIENFTIAFSFRMRIKDI